MDNGFVLLFHIYQLMEDIDNSGGGGLGWGDYILLKMGGETCKQHS